MKIFLSWSGKRSRALAEALNEWIPQIIQAVEPWMSPDIDKGKRWNEEISGQLEQCQVGIICLTKENLTSPWLCFEAGALSKAKSAYTCTLLLGVTSSDVQYPLGMFQHTSTTKEDIYKLFLAINKAVAEHGSNALPLDRLSKLFERFWPDMEEGIVEIANRPGDSTPTPQRTERELLSEVLDIVRAQQREGENLADSTTKNWTRRFNEIVRLSAQLREITKDIEYLRQYLEDPENEDVAVIRRDIDSLLRERGNIEAKIAEFEGLSTRQYSQPSNTVIVRTSKEGE